MRSNGPSILRRESSGFVFGRTYDRCRRGYGPDDLWRIGRCSGSLRVSDNRIGWRKNRANGFWRTNFSNGLRRPNYGSWRVHGSDCLWGRNSYLKIGLDDGRYDG
jgi:hypothetical protein